MLVLPNTQALDDGSDKCKKYKFPPDPTWITVGVGSGNAKFEKLLGISSRWNWRNLWTLIRWFPTPASFTFLSDLQVKSTLSIVTSKSVSGLDALISENFCWLNVCSILLSRAQDSSFQGKMPPDMTSLAAIFDGFSTDLRPPLRAKGSELSYPSNMSTISQLSTTRSHYATK
jgi:hypothetical protein